MKHANWVVVLMLVALSGLAVAQLASNSTIVANVPFEFVVGNKVVPAGQYKVQTMTMDGKSLAIRNADAKVNMVSSTLQTEGKEIASHYSLVFTKYGDTYFLSGIKLEGSKIAYRFPESRAEAELRAQNTPVTEETLLAARE